MKVLIIEDSSEMASSLRDFLLRENYICEIAKGKAEWVTLKKGRAEQGRVEIFGNISSGDSLVVNANEEIRKGSEIN